MGILGSQVRAGEELRMDNCPSAHVAASTQVAPASASHFDRCKQQLVPALSLRRRPIEEGCDCLACRKVTRAFLHNLASKGLPFASNLITYHNISYMMVGS